MALCFFYEAQKARHGGSKAKVALSKLEKIEIVTNAKLKKLTVFSFKRFCTRKKSINGNTF